MKYERAAAFLRDISRLPPEHLAMFREAVFKHFLPALAAGAHTGHVPWPTRLRVHKIVGADVYSLTQSFASPDGRATFSFSEDDDGETVLIWERIGDHRIYDHT